MKAALPAGLVAGLLATVTGVVMAKLALSGAYTAYVRPGMYAFLLAAAVVLVLAGAATALRAALGSGSADRDHDQDHDHDHGAGRLGVPPVALLLVVPLLLVYLGGSAGLGAATAEGDTSEVAAPVQGSSYAPLQVGPDGTATAGILETIQRGLSNDGESLRGHRVRLVGFIAAPKDGRQVATLSRYAISCCAADALLASVDLRWSGGAPTYAAGQWYEVTAEFAGVDRANPRQPRVELAVAGDTVRPVPEPENPYEI